MAIVIAVVSAFIYTGSVAIQQVGNVKADEKSGHPVIRLLTTPLWLLGFLLGLVGFGLHFVALGLGSLVEVQVAQTSQIVFMLPFSAWTAKAALQRREIVGTALVTAGLVVSIILGQVRDGIDQPDNGAWTLAIAITVGVVVVLLVAARAARGVAGGLYGTAAGVVYGVMAALMKDVTATITEDSLGAVFGQWQTYVLIASGMGAIVLQQLALRAGHLSAALSAIAVGTPVASTILGVTIFEETFTTEGFGWVVYAVGVVLAFVGVVMLARSPAIAAATAPTADAPPDDPAVLTSSDSDDV